MAGELNILRLDLDKESKDFAINHLYKRLCYFHDIGFLYFNRIEKILLVKKRTYGAKIYLKFNLKNPNNVIMVESILGSDWRKQTNSLINYHKLNMNYHNRLFDIKRYPGGTYKVSKLIDVTDILREMIKDKSRKTWRN